MSNALIFRIADRESEFTQIHRLNYQTFVEEIPQHTRRDDEILIDPFHDENLYVVCLRADLLLGMLALRDRRPFSLDRKIPDLDAHLPPFLAPCEVRLLAIRPHDRKHAVLRGLLALTAQQCERHGYDLVLISGIESQQKLYARLGFVPFGPLVGNTAARFQPMFLTRETYRRQWQKRLRRSQMRGAQT